MVNNPDWHVSGVVDSVDLENNTITLYIDGFDAPQTILIRPTMPDWLFHPDMAFLTMLPESAVEQRHIDADTAWGEFSKQPYMDMSEEELMEGIARSFKKGGKNK